MSSRTIRIGSRSSDLALAQTDIIVNLLKRIDPDLKTEVEVIKTIGDRDTATALKQMGSTGVFTKRIETALLQGRIQIAVHSAKDLPAIMTGGLSLGAVPTREVCADVLISRNGESLDNLPAGSIVGTGSPRRRALLLRLRPDLQVSDIRGSVITRLAKLHEGQYDALLMAQAGLKRLGLEHEISEILPTERFLPAPGQGFLAVQIRADDHESAALVKEIDDAEAHRCLDIERRLLERLDVGCSVPIGGWARFVGNKLRLSVVVLDSEGRAEAEADHQIAGDRPNKELIDRVKKDLLSQGALDLINR